MFYIWIYMVIKVLWLTAIWCQLTRAAAVSGHHTYRSRYYSSTPATMNMTLATLAVAVNTAALCCQRLQAFLFCYACAQQHPPTLSPFSLSATANMQQSGHHVLRAAWSPCQTEIQDPFATIWRIFSFSQKQFKNFTGSLDSRVFCTRFATYL